MSYDNRPFLDTSTRDDDYNSENDELERIRNYEDFTTIDWIQDSFSERSRRLHIARQIQSSHRGPNGEITWAFIWAQLLKITTAAQTWFVVSLAGMFIGLNAAVMSIVTEWLSDIKMGYCSDGWWLNQQFCCWEIEGDEDACDSWHPWSTVAPGRWLIYIIFAGFFSFTAGHLVRSFAKYAAGSGISEIKCILAGFIMKGFLGMWTLVIKSLTLPLVIASGLSVGKEGPSVHVACCIGNVVANLFTQFSQSQSKMREMITAASAAGVAVAFGSPIGGVLFSIEEMSHTFSIQTMWRSVFCALVATVTLSAMNPFRTGKLVLFQVTYDRDWHFFEIIYFVIIGIFGGLYGALVIKFNLLVAAFRRKHLAKHGLVEAVTLAILTAIVGYPNRFLRIDMTESLAILFRECEGTVDRDNLCQTSVQWQMVNSLFLATVARTVLVIISYGCKVPAGIFVPSMAIGATFGRMVGIMVKAMHRAYPQSGMFAVCQPDAPCITPGTYALLGAAAALGGITRITVSIVVIMFELTGALTYILPTMIVLLATKAVGDMLGVRGIADEMIRFNGFPFLERDDHAFNTTVSNVMRQDLYTLPASGLTVSDVENVLQETDVRGFPIVSANGSRTLLGYIGRTELSYVLEKSKRTRGIYPETPCSFLPTNTSREPQNLQGLASGPAIGIDDVESTELLQTTASPQILKLWPWVNQTPITVPPQLALEVALQMFKRMGPRVILVERHGLLVGLVTVKDILRTIVTVQSDDPSWENENIGGLFEEARVWLFGSVHHALTPFRNILRIFS